MEFIKRKKNCCTFLLKKKKKEKKKKKKNELMYPIHAKVFHLVDCILMHEDLDKTCGHVVMFF